MSYLKAIAKTKKEKEENNKEKNKVDWNKTAMDYETVDQFLYKDIRENKPKVDGLFMQTKGVEKMYQTNTTPKGDMVNHPPHYNHHGIECIDAIQACTSDGFEFYLQGNILKYLWRYKYKNGIEDLQKADWYLQKLIGTVEENTKNGSTS